MAILSKGTTYADGDQITSTNLNALVDSATFAAGAVESGGGLQLNGSSPAQLKVAGNVDIGTSNLTATGTISLGATSVTTLNTSGVVNLNLTTDSTSSTSGALIIDGGVGVAKKLFVGTDLDVDGTTNLDVVDIDGAVDMASTLAVAGVVSVPDGSVSVPSITNTGDTNTGIYFPDENSVALTAGAGARLTCSTSAITIDKPTTIVSTAQTELTLQGGDTNSKNLIFKKASAQQGKITAVGDELKFYAGTSATETLELTTTEAVVTGNLGIGTTSPDEKLDVVGAGRFSTGVTFGTDTAAANKLDDYEEGSWIPTISFGGASVGVEYDLQVGRYTKIGDLVTASCYMDLADKGSSTGNAVLAGLPFASKTLTGGSTPATLRLENISFADIPMGYNGSNTFTIIFQESTNAGTVSTLTDGNFSDTSIVTLSISYRV